MAKDVNIHVKTTGADQTKQELKGVGRSAQEVGNDVQVMGEKSQTGSHRFVDGIQKIIGPLGFMAVLGIVGKVAAGISSFFDTLKKRCDEAVQKLSEVRASFADLFEAMNAIDEKSRMQRSIEAAELLKETRVPQNLGIPVITEYTRQFRPAVERGQITEQQYQEGLRGMLGYAARHGGETTPELITLMGGLGMVTPQQQGALRRQITELSGKTGLTDKDIIEMFGRAMPTIKAMGWSPEQALSTIGVVAAGEISRAKLALPAATLEALMTPQVTELQEKYGISQGIARDPRALFAQIALKSQKMDRQAMLDMLQDIYGSAAPGIYKLITSPQQDIAKALAAAGGPAGVAAETAEEAKSRETLERLQAQTNALILLDTLNRTNKEIYESIIRRIGSSKREEYRLKQPIRQWIREQIIKVEEEEKETAAMRAWWESLSREEQNRILEEKKSVIKAWESMPPQQRYEPLNRLEAPQPQPNITYHNEYHHDIIYNPFAGTASDREIGPRANRDFK
jgi:hypothetical protein